jgi:DNA-binding NarL/FixJ family response regulator
VQEKTPAHEEHHLDAALKVLLADDHPLILQGLRRSLEACEDIEVVGEAHSGTELLALVERRAPDVVLLDMRMPEPDGLECVREIRKSWPEVRTVILSACDDAESIDSALLAGANAYVLKSVGATDVAAVLRQVSAGGAVFHAPSRPGATEGSDGGSHAPLLTERERAILTAVAGGKTSKVISSELWVSEHTVKFHLTNIYRKLGVSNRSGAIRYAYEHGLISA